ncbi:MAG: hypothetical protein EBS19_03055, partial [Spirochaetia bacterium]|nr:hypothetical protein [Spirochaetia bacterium]
DLQKLLTKYRSVYAFPKDFMDFKDKPDCSEKAKLLNQLVRTLWSTDPDFNTFHYALLNFSVKTKDSIYYPCCEDCNGLFCTNKKYALPKYLSESKQFLFKRGSARARRVKNSKRGSARARRVKKSKSIKRNRRDRASNSPLEKGRTPKLILRREGAGPLNSPLEKGRTPKPILRREGAGPLNSPLESGLRPNLNSVGARTGPRH